MNIDLLIEGIFGVGLSREVGGVYKEVIERINACGKPVIAIDIPSGISGDSGKILGCAVHASSTVYIGGYKKRSFIISRTRILWRYQNWYP